MSWEEGGGLDVNNGIRLTEFSLEIKKGNCEDEIVNRDAHATLCINFLFKRHLTYQLINTFLPSFLLVIASLGVFLMKPQSASERITLSINALLALFIIYGRTRQSLPPTGRLTYADIWLIGCLLFVLLVNMECCVVELLGYTETELEEREGNQKLSVRRSDNLQRYLQDLESQLPRKMKSRDKAGPTVSIPCGKPGRSAAVHGRQRSPILEPTTKCNSVISSMKKLRLPSRPRFTTEQIDMWAGVAYVGGFTTFTLGFWITVVKNSSTDQES